MSSADQQAGRGPPAAQGLSGRTAPAGHGRGSCGGCPCNGFGLTGEMRATARRPIPVAIDCCNDPREVKKVLLKVARENPDVLSTPAPAAVFEDFGESFNFKLFVYYDTNKDIQTDLRVAILEAFHSSGFRKMAYLSDDSIQHRPRVGRCDNDRSALCLARGEKDGAYC